MQFLTPQDRVFLSIEKHHQPMHVGALMLFSYPKGSSHNYVSELMKELRNFKNPKAPFDKKLMTFLGQYYFSEDENIDLEYHLRHVALPKPGRIRELLAFVSAEHSNLMDRKRPLWQFHIIEGVEGDRFAVYCKIHHTIIDGVSGIKMTTNCFSSDPSARNISPFWMRPDKNWETPLLKPTKAKTLPNKKSEVSFVERYRSNLYSTSNVLKETCKTYLNIDRGEDFVSPIQAPQTMLNTQITASRRFVAQSYRLSRIKKIGKAFEATINDVILAICGSALRDYLISHEKLPAAPLIALQPVSLRDEKEAGDNGEVANQIGMIFVSLGTHIADPVLRIQEIKASARDAKQRLSSMNKNEILAYSALTLFPTAANSATGMLPNFLGANVLISNVPGSKETLYWNGARLEGMYPVSIPMDSLALNITLLSYSGQLEFGLTACRRAMPSMQRLLDYIENGIRDLETAMTTLEENKDDSDHSGPISMLECAEEIV
ncbi:MAG: wax ester/triacylglycerol synthase family O-acyltransferase [Pseudomonadales bacterium]|nr:wax ester/triacylglycerol synthase family O-acyltransferase [Pseudomonadales bacterium]